MPQKRPEPELPSILEAISSVSSLQWYARHAVDGTLTGVHRSGLFGSSIEFAEHKPYSPGDDLRHVDWKVLARADKFTLKRFEDETNLRAYLVLDSSSSLNFGSVGYTKFQFATVLSAALAYLFIQQQDLVALLCFGKNEPLFTPPRGRMPHFQRMAETLTTLKAEGEGKLDGALAYLRDRIHKRGAITVVSDFILPMERLAPLAKGFQAQGHDVSWLHVLDPAEIDFPFQGWTRFKGLEGEGDVESDPREIGRSYRDEVKHWIESVRNLALEHSISHRLVRTDEPIAQVLGSFVT